MTRLITGYSAKPDVDEVSDLTGDEKEEAKKNNEAARLWISGLKIVERKLGITRVMNLSATPSSCVFRVTPKEPCFRGG
jgi:hypothetical protein